MAGRGLTLGNRLAPPRFVGFVVLLVAGTLASDLLWPHLSWQDDVALGFDLAAATFLLSLIPLLRGSSSAAMRQHARDNDANRGWVLVLTSSLTLAIMAAISGELERAGQGDPLALVRLIATLALIWLFANSVYALHYAHAFYTDDQGKDAGGISFPGTRTPDYLDFAYFAFTLGMTFQTSDVEISARPIRRVVLLHSMAAFVFNIGVIAFTINALSGK